MTIRFLCPRGHKLAVPDNLAGKKGRCPTCQQRVYIPVPESADAESAGSASADTAGYSPQNEPSDPAAPAGALPPGFAGMPGGAIADYPGQSPESPPYVAPSYAVPPAASPLAPWPDAAGGLPPSLAPVRPAGMGVESFPASNGEPVEYAAGPPPIPPMGALGSESEPRFDSPPDLAAPPAWADMPQPPPTAAPLQELSVIIDEPEEGYQADPGKVQTTYMLAMALGALTLLCAAPALRHPNLVEAPNWARVVLVASALQLVFICWMVSLPDWSTVWISMVVFAVVAAFYGVAWAVISFTPDYMPVNFLDLDEPPDDPVRSRAGPWCFVMLMLATLLTYACGRFSGRWRKQYEMAKALRE